MLLIPLLDDYFPLTYSKIRYTSYPYAVCRWLRIVSVYTLTL